MSRYLFSYVLIGALPYILQGCFVAEGIYDLSVKGHLTTPHESFLSHYQYFVGKKFDKGYWSNNILNSSRLANGNIAVEIAPGFSYKKGCRVFYEYLDESKIIISFKYSPDDSNGANIICVAPVGV